MKHLKTTIEYLGYAILFIALGVLMAILSPLIAGMIIYAIISDRKLDKQSTEYLKSLEGTSWFYYTNRRSSQKLVEGIILPAMPDTIHVVRFNGHRPIVPQAFDGELLSRSIATEFVPAPGIMTVVNGNLKRRSLHDDLYHPAGGIHNLDPKTFIDTITTKLEKLQHEEQTDKSLQLL